MMVFKSLKKEMDEDLMRTRKQSADDPKVLAIGNAELFPIWTYFQTSNKLTYGCMTDVVGLSKYCEMMTRNI